MRFRIGEVVQPVTFIKGSWVKMPLGKIVAIGEHHYEVDLNFNGEVPRIMGCCLVYKVSK